MERWVIGGPNTPNTPMQKMSHEVLDELDLIIKHNPRVISSAETKWADQEILRMWPRAGLTGPQPVRSAHVNASSAEAFLAHARVFTVNLEQMPGLQANSLKNEITALGGSVVLVPDNGVMESRNDGMIGEARTLQHSNTPKPQLHCLIASATQSQFQNLAAQCTDAAKPLAELICDCLSRYDRTSFRLLCRNPKRDSIDIDVGLTHTGIMGILNVTPDSFSDGSRFYSFESAVEQARSMAAEGADIIDVGGESTRPNAAPVSVDEEKRRTIPVIQRLSQEIEAPISIDTRKADVAEEAIQAGASIVNDVGGLRDDSRMAEVVAEHRVAVIIMHKRGTPQNMQDAPGYVDLMSEITRFLRQSIRIAVNAGVDEQKILIDPGIGFGKTVADNLEILDRLSEFRSLGRPILIGTSRKSTIGHILDAPVDKRLIGSLASAAMAISNGAHIVRVHDVEETVQLAKVCNAIASNRNLDL